MLKISQISKNYDHVPALDHVSLAIEDGNIWGILGVNGAGKSTLLKIIAGILKPDAGTVMIDDEPLYDNPKIKKEVFFLSDDAYFFPNATVETMATFYHSVYPEFDIMRYRELYEALGFDNIRKIRTFSKGMKRQIFILLALCSNTRYLLCDEIFDGLDPIVRKTIQELLVREVKNRKLTLIVASHNLKELENFCDSLGIIHHGGILLSKEIRHMQLHTHKFQCIFSQDKTACLQDGLDLIGIEQQGFLVTLLARGTAAQIREVIIHSGAEKYQELPLTVEEIFVNESEVIGYDISAIIS